MARCTASRPARWKSSRRREHEHGSAAPRLHLDAGWSRNPGPQRRAAQAEAADRHDPVYDGPAPWAGDPGAPLAGRAAPDRVLLHVPAHGVRHRVPGLPALRPRDAAHARAGFEQAEAGGRGVKTHGEVPYEELPARVRVAFEAAAQAVCRRYGAIY